MLMDSGRSCTFDIVFARVADIARLVLEAGVQSEAGYSPLLVLKTPGINVAASWLSIYRVAKCALNCVRRTKRKQL